MALEVIALTILSLIYVLFLALSILKKDPGNKKMQEISKAVQQGSMTFLKREYQILAIFIIVVFIIISLFIKVQTALSFLLGSIFSILSGFI